MSNCPSTPLRRREKSRRQQAIIDEVGQEILGRTRQKTTNAFSQDMQSCKERLPDCATGCVRPGAATASQEEPCPPKPGAKTRTGAPVPMSILPAASLLASSCSWISSYTAPWSKDPLAGPRHNGSDGSGPRPAAHIAKRCFLN